MAKKYRIINEKYGEVGSEATFAEIKRTAKENSADLELTEDSLNDGRDVVRDGHNVIVAETSPAGFSGGVTNRDREKGQEE